MIVGISDITLYVGLTATGGNHSALAQEWFAEQGIEHKTLWYGDPAQHDQVFEAINSWRLGTVTDFPFVTYEEKHDDFTTVRQILIGLDAIQNSTLPELYALSQA